MSLDTTVRRSRRALLTAAAGAAAATAAAALSRPLQVTAASGDPLILGQVNASLVDHTRLDGTLDVFNVDSNGRAITAQDVSVIGSEGAGVEGSSTNGTGLLGTSQGATGHNSSGVKGISQTVGGVGVAAISLSAGTALYAQGKVRLATRSGRTTVAAGKASVDIDLRQKGGLAGTPLGFAVLVSYRPGVFVTTVRPNYPIKGKARIYLNRAVTSTTYVAWFVLN
jgi:hypothetical protein